MIEYVLVKSQHNFKTLQFEKKQNMATHFADSISLLPENSGAFL